MFMGNQKSDVQTILGIFFKNSLIVEPIQHELGILRHLKIKLAHML